MKTLWGWGAISVGQAPKGWRCRCGRVNRAGDTEANIGRHTYPFDGLQLCTDCAHAFHDEVMGAAANG